MKHFYLQPNYFQQYIDPQYKLSFFIIVTHIFIVFYVINIPDRQLTISPCFFCWLFSLLTDFSKFILNFLKD